MTEETARERIGAALRRNGRGVATELLVNVVLPYVVYDLAKPRLGDVHALMASSGPPIIWAIVEFVRRRRVDFISIFVLAGIALSLLAMAGGGSVKFLQLRERLVTAAIGLAFVISALIRKPLIYEFARASMRRNQSDQLADFEARRDNVHFRRAMMTLTLVWGFGLLAEAAVAATLVWTLTIKQYLIAGPILGYSTMGALALWTFLYARARRRAAAAREAVSTADAQPVAPASS